MNITLCGIGYGCPHGKREKDCPFYKMDHLSFIEKVYWIIELSDEMELAITNYHKYCTTKRETKSSGYVK